MIPKFRCWDEPNKTMRFNDEIVIWSGQVYINEKKELDAKIKGFSCLPEYLMQSTGLKDKNGMEIFEGDVLLHTSSSVNYSDTYWHSYVQAYRMNSGAYRIKGKHIYDTELMSSRNRIEVVGNIYQHQNLLEKEYFSTSDDIVEKANES